MGQGAWWADAWETMSGQQSDYSSRAFAERSADIAQDRQLALNEDAYNKSVKLTDMEHEFQERMSSTALQRQMADADKAGLNPLLIFGNPGSGASSPGGAPASFAGGSAPSARASQNKAGSAIKDFLGSAVKLATLLALAA